MHIGLVGPGKNGFTPLPHAAGFMVSTALASPAETACSGSGSTAATARS